MEAGKKDGDRERGAVAAEKLKAHRSCRTSSPGAWGLHTAQGAPTQSCRVGKRSPLTIRWWDSVGIQPGRLGTHPPRDEHACHCSASLGVHSPDPDGWRGHAAILRTSAVGYWPHRAVTLRGPLFSGEAFGGDP